MNYYSPEVKTPVPEPTKTVREQGEAHYKGMSIEPWDVIDTWPVEQQIGFYRGNLLKYAMRLGTKDARLKEARKASHYALKLIKVLENLDHENQNRP